MSAQPDRGEYKPQWPAKPEPVYCVLCEKTKHVFALLASPDEVDVELVCGHRVLTTTRRRGSDGAS